MSKELLIKGGYVITVDPDLGDLPSGDVLVTDGLITAVGPDLAPASAGAEVIEATGRLVIPGLVDTHRHVWQGAIGGYTPQITGAGYGPAVLTGIALKHSPEDVYAGTLWGALQALDAGITTIADWAHNDQSAAHADADLRGLRDSGIQAATSSTAPVRPPAAPGPLRHRRHAGPAAGGRSGHRRTRSGHRRSQPAAPGGRPPHARSVLRFRRVRAAADGHGAARALFHQRRAQRRGLRVRPGPGTADLGARGHGGHRRRDHDPAARPPARPRRQLRARQHAHRPGVRPHRRNPGHGDDHAVHRHADAVRHLPGHRGLRP